MRVAVLTGIQIHQSLETFSRVRDALTRDSRVNGVPYGVFCTLASMKELFPDPRCVEVFEDAKAVTDVRFEFVVGT